MENADATEMLKHEAELKQEIEKFSSTLDVAIETSVLNKNVMLQIKERIGEFAKSHLCAKNNRVMLFSIKDFFTRTNLPNELIDSSVEKELKSIKLTKEHKDELLGIELTKDNYPFKDDNNEYETLYQVLLKFSYFSTIFDEPIEKLAEEPLKIDGEVFKINGKIFNAIVNLDRYKVNGASTYATVDRYKVNDASVYATGIIRDNFYKDISMTTYRILKNHEYPLSKGAKDAIYILCAKNELLGALLNATQNTINTTINTKDNMAIPTMGASNSIS